MIFTVECTLEMKNLHMDKIIQIFMHGETMLITRDKDYFITVVIVSLIKLQKQWFVYILGNS